MSDVLEFVLPGRPGYEEQWRGVKGKAVRFYRPVLTANSRAHWSVRQRVMKQDKLSVFGALLEKRGQLRAMGCPWDRVSIGIDFLVPVKRPRDPDNTVGLAKGVIDGLVEHGVLTGDDQEVVADLRVSWLVVPGQQYACHVRVAPMGG